MVTKVFSRSSRHAAGAAAGGGGAHGRAPYFYNHKLKSAGTPTALHFGSRYPLGHGLGYTTFAYSDLTLAQARVPIDGSEDIALAFTVRNTGGRSGVEVAQLYVRDRHASVVRPVRELKAFQWLVLAPGEAARVQFSVPRWTCFK